MRADPVRVAIDLETTGLHPEQDAIIEIGAVKFAGDEMLDTFETFVSPGLKLPYRIRRLTGITEAELRGAPPLAKVLPGLQTFIGDVPLVGHSIPFDVAFLRRAGLARRNPQIDTYELASMLLPGLTSYTLASVGDALGVSAPTYHRALADAILSRDVFLALIRRLEDLDTSVLEALNELSAPADWTPGYLVRGELRRRNTPRARSQAFAGTLGDQIIAKLGIDPSVLGFAVAGTAGDLMDVAEQPAQTPAPPALPRADDAVARCLDDGGVLVRETEMDGDGYDTSLAAAVEWIGAHDDPVVVSVGSTGEMMKVARERLPRLLAAAGFVAQESMIAEVAEHESYLCLHRWFGYGRVARDGVFPRETVRGLAKLVVWAGKTSTGSRAELALPWAEVAAWDLVRSGHEFADSTSTCIYRRDGYCFVAKAMAAAAEARIIVTTHAALAAQLMGRDTILPPARRTLLLDAHLLEDELRRAMSFTFARAEVVRLLGSLATTEENGKRVGLLHLAKDSLAAPNAPERERQWFGAVERARHAVDALFHSLARLLVEAQRQAGGRGDHADIRNLPLSRRVRELEAWSVAARDWATLENRLLEIAQLLREIARETSGRKGERTARGSGMTAELLGTARMLDHLRAQVGGVFSAPDERTVYYLRVPYENAGEQESPANQNGRGRHHAQRGGSEQRHGPQQNTQNASEPRDIPDLVCSPVRVDQPLARLHGEEKSLILAGPALAVGGDFAFFSGTFALPDTTQTISTASDRAEQTLLCMPNDVPEPNAPQYQQHLDELLIDLARALEGRMVVIFPSHAALRASANSIRRALETRDILVLAQGLDGSIRQLWQTFKNEQRVVLLGAGAFWDVSTMDGMPPACIVVTRLPFPALSDPLMAARAAAWVDPQNQFVVPVAALKLRQALGGLAWSHSRRNAVVLFDRRLQTRGYGQTVLGTLPRCTQYQEPAAHLPERIAEWVSAPSYG